MTKVVLCDSNDEVSPDNNFRYCNNVNEFEFIFPHTMMRITRNCDDNDFDPVQMSQ